MKDVILKYALQNALKFGRANAGAVLGHVLSENPELKKDVKTVQAEINQAIESISSLNKDQVKQKLEELAPEMLEKKKSEKKGLVELPNADGQITTRIPPEPSKYNHIGHALSFLLNYMYAKKYKGKCILRFEDTNPSASKQEYVDAMKEDVLEYLDIKPDKTVFVSDDMEKFYSHAEQLIEQGHAYVCSCEREIMQKNRNKGIACKCRDKKSNEWKDMLAGKFKEGERVLRLKADMESKNHAMRDPVIMRIANDTHYRHGDKYKIWPLYDFENALEDCWCEITHILRSNEFGNMRIELQDFIKKLFNYNTQTVVQYGRFNIVGAVSQGREIRELIEKGEMTGWDDPRLVTLKALKRRGIVKETFYELAIEVGLSPSPTNIDFMTLAKINRRLLDKTAERYFFVENPKQITIKGAPSLNVELDLHPDNKKGGRKFTTTDKFYISQDDYNSLKDGMHRLMGCLNFRKKGDSYEYVSEDVEQFRKEGDKIIHWLPDGTETKILMPDNTFTKGLAESAAKIKPGSVIQFERFGFCRKEGDNFVFGHK